MTLKTSANYSPNFNTYKRPKKTIKFIILHYTGMKTEPLAIKKLCSFNSKVSCHYFIKDSGKILTIVPNLYEAWHAGISKWKKIKSLNKYSIGIEINNPGHKHGYKSFSNKQIKSLKNLLKYLMKKFNISYKNILGHSDIAPDRKKDPGEKFIVKKLGIERFNFHKRKKFSINRLLKFYGFSQNYIKIHKADCIKAVKRSLNYKTIDSSVSKNFKNKFNNLLFK